MQICGSYQKIVLKWTESLYSSEQDIVFTGEGADEILLGYDLFGETKIRNFWSKFPSSKRRPELLKKLYYYLPQFKNSRYFEITKEFYKKNLMNNKKNFYSHQTRWDQYFMITIVQKKFHLIQ